MIAASLQFAFLISSVIGISTASSCAKKVDVDLGYSVYTGCYNASTQLNVFKGIRYAAPPTGVYRWQLPQAPAENRSHPIPALEFPPRCPQGTSGPAVRVTPKNFKTLVQGDEDCLFLNVYAPPNGKDLPVMVYIHGGGYAELDAALDPSILIQSNNHGFIVVLIQYRLGAFGFLSGNEVQQLGTSNAGLFDQQFALEWVQSQIHKFGGNASAVTVAGESAGGGSVVQQAIAYGGNMGTKLFRNLIASSPYLPAQNKARGAEPNRLFRKFAAEVGCALNSTKASLFDCLVSKDTKDLQLANFKISGSGAYGSYVWVPVVDGNFIRQRPTLQLQKGQVNGLNALIGNNANEGVAFTKSGIKTVQDVERGIRAYFPNLNSGAVNEILQVYQLTRDSEVQYNAKGRLYSSSGTHAPYALNQSIFAVGYQQALTNIIGESTLLCSSFSMVDAYASRGKVFKYQFSAIPAIHGEDVVIIFAPGDITTKSLPAGIQTALRAVWANFVIHSDPSPRSPSQYKINGHVKQEWPTYERGRPMQLDFNVTGGTLTEAEFDGMTLPAIIGNATNVIRVNNAIDWEGGRGGRCDLWRALGPQIPY